METLVIPVYVIQKSDDVKCKYRADYYDSNGNLHMLASDSLVNLKKVIKDKHWNYAWIFEHGDISFYSPKFGNSKKFMVS